MIPQVDRDLDSDLGPLALFEAVAVEDKAGELVGEDPQPNSDKSQMEDVDQAECHQRPNDGHRQNPYKEGIFNIPTRTKATRIDDLRDL